MASRRALGWIVGVLAISLVGQGATVLLMRTRAVRLAENPLLPGQTLRGHYLGQDLSPFPVPDGCWHLYFASAQCPACARLAGEVSSLEEPARVMWAFEDSHEAAHAFAQRYGLDPSAVLTLRPRRRLQEMGVFATPTAATLVGRTVIALEMAEGPLTQSSAAARCAQAE